MRFRDILKLGYEQVTLVPYPLGYRALILPFGTPYKSCKWTKNGLLMTEKIKMEIHHYSKISVLRIFAQAKKIMLNETGFQTYITSNHYFFILYQLSDSKIRITCLGISILSKTADKCILSDGYIIYDVRVFNFDGKISNYIDLTKNYGLVIIDIIIEKQAPHAIDVEGELK